MKEELLHYVWRFQQYQLQDLQTTQGEPLLVIHPGQYNTHAGPDFLNGQIRLSNTLWYGHIEIHLRASDWLVHAHQQDPAYQNVILHVVLEEDQPIYRSNGTRIPCLELQARVFPEVLRTYRKLYQRPWQIPCAPLIQQVPHLTRMSWLDRMQTERLQIIAQRILQILQHNKGDWTQTRYQWLARGFGLQVNQDPFELLARQTPLSLVQRHRAQLDQLEALFFGQAGLLAGNHQDEYPKDLQREYQFLQHKYQLSPIPVHTWKFSRMRPASFPTIRLAQWAQLMHQRPSLWGDLMDVRHLEDVTQLFAVEASGYWANHYRFDQIAAFQVKRMGRTMIHRIAINVLAPLYYAYGLQMSHDGYCQLAQQLLEDIPAENNRVIREWKKLHVVAQHAGDSQALLQLRRFHCDQQKCLTCAIGVWLLQHADKE